MPTPQALRYHVRGTSASGMGVLTATDFWNAGTKRQSHLPHPSRAIRALSEGENRRETRARFNNQRGAEVECVK
jgi:hypothetical protein